MKKRDPLSTVLHALMHLAASDAPMTSEALAACLSTHAVVVRRTMASLREAGLVRSAGGRGGGWQLARPAAEISLGHVYSAIGESVFAAGERPLGHAGCLIEKAVGSVIDGVVSEAEALLASRLQQITLADLARQLKEHHHEH